MPFKAIEFFFVASWFLSISEMCGTIQAPVGAEEFRPKSVCISFLLSFNGRFDQSLSGPYWGTKVLLSIYNPNLPPCSGTGRRGAGYDNSPL